MSEQTPETAASAPSEGGFIGSDDEPSMEDILASIRKIIADDSDPVPLDGPAQDNQFDVARQSTEQASSGADESFDLVGVTVEASHSSADIEADNLDIESLLSNFEVSDSASDIQSGGTVGLNGETGILSLDDELAIPEIDDDELSATAITPTGNAVASVADVSLGLDSSVDDDMDRMMNELLVDLESVPDPTENADLKSLDGLSDVQTADSASADAAGDADLDLVKSLMADLTDDDEDMVVTADADVTVDDLDPLDALEDDILESILDMTLDDEVAAMEAQARAAGGPSLAEIAASAESDSDNAETSVDQGDDLDATEAVTDILDSMMTELSADSLAEISDIIDATETEKSVAEPTAQKSEPIQTSPDTPEMETSMPRAIRSDAILDDVTEEATMSAFAQLNQVVEDKAILSERGPRVGDLVQDALRPMLKEWLDENLQGIVERAVTKEVQRLANGK